MSLRSCAMALAALALAGCATDYNGYYDTYPGYYDPYYGPYYGGGAYGYHSRFYDFDDDDDRYFRPERNVICDRGRDVCYDRYGLSYTATREFFGEREAKRAYRKYGDSVFLFSPREGVTCNRRTETCTRPQWTQRIFGDEPSRPRQLDRRNIRPDRDDDDRAADDRLPRRLRERIDDDDAGPILLPPARARDTERTVERSLPAPNRRADDIGPRRSPPARLERDDNDQPRSRPGSDNTGPLLLPRTPGRDR
jgi:hypothetical protein